jgi:hypothetical protein
MTDPNLRKLIKTSRDKQSADFAKFDKIDARRDEIEMKYDLEEMDLYERKEKEQEELQEEYDALDLRDYKSNYAISFTYKSRKLVLTLSEGGSGFDVRCAKLSKGYARYEKIIGMLERLDVVQEDQTHRTYGSKSLAGMSELEIVDLAAECLVTKRFAKPNKKIVAQELA